MRPKKRLGQHFLNHRAILERIVDALAPAPGDIVIEIGPGRGTLTEVLAARGARVAAIEKDQDLIPQLRERFPAVRIIPGDALELDWRLAAGLGPEEPILVTGNIPYNITSPLLDRALEPPRPRRIVFLVQKEVAERLTAAPGGKVYGALSVGVQSVAAAEKLFLVPAGAFHPPPAVDSAVVRLTPLALPVVADSLVPSFRRLVVGLFGFRRKQLGRGLREFTRWPPARVVELLRASELDPAARPETLSPREFAALLNCLIDAGWRLG